MATTWIRRLAGMVGALAVFAGMGGNVEAAGQSVSRVIADDRPVFDGNNIPHIWHRLLPNVVIVRVSRLDH